MNQQLIKDWQEFSAPTLRQDSALPGTLRLRVQADLYPFTLRIAVKMAICIVLSGTGAYFLYPLIGLKWLFSLLGPNPEIFLRGFTFETAILWTVSLFLWPEQMTAVSARRSIILLGLIATSFAGFVFIAAGPIHLGTYLWLLGATLATFSQASLLFPISQS